MKKNRLFLIIFAIFLLFPGLLLCSCGKKYDINIILSGDLAEEYISSVTLKKTATTPVQYRESVTVSKQYQFEIVYKNGYDISDVYVNGTDKNVEVKKVKGEDTWWKIVFIFTPKQDKTYLFSISEPRKMLEEVGVEFSDDQLENCGRDLAQEIKIFARHDGVGDFYPLSNFSGENSEQYKLVFDLTEKIAQIKIKMPNMFTNAALGKLVSAGELYFTCRQDKDDVCLYTFSMNVNSSNYTFLQSNIKLNLDLLQDENSYIAFEINSDYESDESAYKFKIISAKEDDGNFDTNLKKTFGKAKTYKAKLDRTYSSQEEAELLNMLDLFNIKVFIGDRQVATKYNDIEDTFTFTLQNYDLPCDYNINENKFNFAVRNLQLKNGNSSYNVQTEINFNNELSFDDKNLNEFKYSIDENYVKTSQYASPLSPKNKIEFKSNYNLLTSIYSQIDLTLNFMGNNYTINDIDILTLLNSGEDVPILSLPNTEEEEGILPSENVDGVTIQILYKAQDKRIYIDAIYDGSNCSRFNGVTLELSGEEITFTLEFKSSDFETGLWEYKDSSTLGTIENDKVGPIASNEKSISLPVATVTAIQVIASNEKTIDFSISTILKNASWGNESTWGMKITYFGKENEIQPQNALIIENGGSMSQSSEGITITKKMTLTNGGYYIQNSDGQYELLTKIVCDFVKTL